MTKMSFPVSIPSAGAVANRRADLVVSSLLRYVTDIDEVKDAWFLRVC